VYTSKGGVSDVSGVCVVCVCVLTVGVQCGMCRVLHEEGDDPGDLLLPLPLPLHWTRQVREEAQLTCTTPRPHTQAQHRQTREERSEGGVSMRLSEAVRPVSEAGV
jgi:hypothetical protein